MTYCRLAHILLFNLDTCLPFFNVVKILISGLSKGNMAAVVILWSIISNSIKLRAKCTSSLMVFLIIDDVDDRDLSNHQFYLYSL